MDDVVQAAGAAGAMKTAAGMSGAKLAGFAGAGFTMAAVVVMAMTAPPTRKEFLIALISTLAFSMGAGGSVVMYFQLQNWAHDIFGLMGILGICFTCGLPGWILVRSVFLFSEHHKDKDIGQMIAIIRRWFK